MIRFVWVVSIVACLAACSAPIKLDTVPVEDRAGANPMDSLGSSGGSQAGGQSTVAAVNTAQVNSEAAILAAGRTVYFDFDSFLIRPEFQGLIESSARSAQTNAAQKLTIEGHTDERGGREYNLALGQKRADAVRRALSLTGIADARMESISFGKEKPAVAGSTEASMEKNRRAEISIR